MENTALIVLMVMGVITLIFLLILIAYKTKNPPLPKTLIGALIFPIIMIGFSLIKEFHVDTGGFDFKLKEMTEQIQNPSDAPKVAQMEEFIEKQGVENMDLEETRQVRDAYKRANLKSKEMVFDDILKAKKSSPKDKQQIPPTQNTSYLIVKYGGRWFESPSLFAENGELPVGHCFKIIQKTNQGPQLWYQIVFNNRKIWIPSIFSETREEC